MWPRRSRDVMAILGRPRILGARRRSDEVDAMALRWRTSRFSARRRSDEVSEIIGSDGTPVKDFEARDTTASMVLLVFFFLNHRIYLPNPIQSLFSRGLTSTQSTVVPSDNSTCSVLDASHKKAKSSASDTPISTAARPAAPKSPAAQYSSQSSSSSSSSDQEPCVPYRHDPSAGRC